MFICRGGGNLELAPQWFLGDSYAENEFLKESSVFLKAKVGLLRQKPRNDRFGFTLAEVLITLGIIGVVAALTLPALISLYQKKIVETRLEHTYSLVSQALKMAVADYGDSQYWTKDIAGYQGTGSDVVDVFLNTYFLPYIKGYKSGIVDGYGLYKLGYNVRTVEYGGLVTSSRYVCLNNGINLFLSYAKGRQGVVCVTILVDINGHKAPNVVGRDLFQMKYSLYDGILFMSGERQVTGYGLTYDKIIKYDDIYTRCKSGGNNLLECGALIKQNGWKIPNDYPYRI